MLFGSKKTIKLFWIISPLFYTLIPIILHNNTYASYTLSVTSSGSQSIDVVPSQNTISTSIGVDNITVNTTCRSGYNFSISTSINNNNLYLNGNSSSDTYLTPINNSALNSTANTWGYYFNNDSPTATPTDSNIFNTIPTKNSTPATIKSQLATPSSTDISDHFNIYYGAAVSNTLKPGIYKMIPDTNNSNNDGTIVYYVTLADNCIPYVIHFNPTSTSTGSTLSGTGTMSDQETYKDIATPLTPNGFTPPSGYEFKEWNTAQDGTGTSYKDGVSVTNLTTPGNTITLYAIWRIPPTPLYNKVASLVKTDSNNNPRTQTAAELRATITEPTSSNPATDTSNSGVFLYDASTFGAASDASNDYPIYYYRGILDSNLDGTSSTYGSNGNGEYYPNYIKLTTEFKETCWRIVRTTGSGGIKIIYNGLFGATTANSCANSQWKTTHNESSSKYQSINSSDSYLVYSGGYTYNPSFTTTSAQADTYSALFGTNSNFSVNSADSSVKYNLENSWFSSNLDKYSNTLEPSAGYCSDRTLYSSQSASALLTDNDIVEPKTGQWWFGPYIRNAINNQSLSLTCPRNIVDLYTTNTANDGNKQLKYPIALLTTDEAALAGNGASATNSSSSFHANSYLRSGGEFFLISPYRRYNYPFASVIKSDGSLGNEYMYNNYAGTRPAISLNHDTKIYSGSGTVTDPWIIDDD